MPQTAERVTPRAVEKFLVLTATVFVAYFVAGKLGQAATSIRSSNLGPVWPAYGVALAAFLLCGYRVWLGIAASAFVVAFSSPVPPLAAAGQAAGATLAALTGAYLLRHVVKFNPSLSRLRDALSLIVFGALGSAMVSASIGVSILYATHVRAYSGLGPAWLIYWFGDSTGVLLVTPLILTAPTLSRIRPRERLAEFVALLFLLTLACSIIFGDLPLIPVKLHVLAFAVLPFVIWAAIRFGVSGVSLATLVVATIATAASALGSGPFAQNTPFTNAVLLDVFFAVLSVSGMTLAAVIAEREHADRERERLVRQQATVEARLRLATIVESSDDAIIGEDIDGTITDWNKGAERLYGYSSNEAIGKPASLLLLPASDGDSVEVATNHGAINHHETVHERKDRTRIEVSLTRSPISDAAGHLVGASAIVRDITERKRTEEALRESEDKLRLILDSTAEAIYGIDLEGRCTFCNSACLRALGYGGFDEVLGQNMHQLIQHSRADGTPFPAEESRMFDACRTGEGVHVADEVLWTAGGTSFPAEYWSYPQRRRDKVVGAVVAFIDISQRKLAEEALSSVSRRLILAQEKERTRIARELHDDIVQRLAMLTIGLDQLQLTSPDLPAGVRSRISELRKRTSDITADIQSLSHELHSSRLQHLGLAAAMKGFCEEFGQQQDVEIDFDSRDLPSPLPPDISLCLFRVLQEALRNSAKHSRARQFDVQLWGTSGDIHLIVSDLGVGFNPATAVEGRGIGLISMQERLQLVKGVLSIDSHPERGTTIHAYVPVSAKDDSMLAAG